MGEPWGGSTLGEKSPEVSVIDTGLIYFLCALVSSSLNHTLPSSDRLQISSPINVSLTGILNSLETFQR